MEVKKESRVAGETGALRSDTKGKGRYDCVLLGYPHMIFRLARLLEQGIESGYPAGNWKRGTNLRRWLEGGFRHLCQFAEGKTDEDHLIAAIWNLLSLGETKYLVDSGARPAELDDLPGQQPMLTPAACSDEANIRRREELLKRVNEGGELLNDRENDELQDTLRAENNLIGCQGDPDPEPGDRRINPETGQEEIFVKWDSSLEHEWRVYSPLSRRYSATEITKLIEFQHGQPTYYICGPMRGYPFFNFPAFDGARDLGQSLGFNIISPADLDRQAGIDPIEDPGCAERMQQADPNNFIKNIVKRDIIEIWNLDPKKGDGLALLPGWEESTGALAEIALANWLGLSFVDAKTFEPISNPLEV